MDAPEIDLCVLREPAEQVVVSAVPGAPSPPHRNTTFEDYVGASPAPPLRIVTLSPATPSVPFAAVLAAEEAVPGVPAPAEGLDDPAASEDVLRAVDPGAASDAEDEPPPVPRRPVLPPSRPPPAPRAPATPPVPCPANLRPPPLELPAARARAGSRRHARPTPAEELQLKHARAEPRRPRGLGPRRPRTPAGGSTLVRPPPTAQVPAPPVFCEPPLPVAVEAVAAPAAPNLERRLTGLLAVCLPFACAALALRAPARPPAYPRRPDLCGSPDPFAARAPASTEPAAVGPAELARIAGPELFAPTRPWLHVLVRESLVAGAAVAAWTLAPALAPALARPLRRLVAHPALRRLLGAARRRLATLPARLRLALVRARGLARGLARVRRAPPGRRR